MWKFCAPTDHDAHLHQVLAFEWVLHVDTVERVVTVHGSVPQVHWIAVFQDASLHGSDDNNLKGNSKKLRKAGVPMTKTNEDIIPKCAGADIQ